MDYIRVHHIIFIKNCFECSVWHEEEKWLQTNVVIRALWLNEWCVVLKQSCCKVQHQRSKTWNLIMKIPLVCMLMLSMAQSVVSFSLQPSHTNINFEFKEDDTNNSSSRRDVFKKVMSVTAATVLVLGGEIENAQAIVSRVKISFASIFIYFQSFIISLWFTSLMFNYKYF